MNDKPVQLSLESVDDLNRQLANLNKNVQDLNASLAAFEKALLAGKPAVKPAPKPAAPKATGESIAIIGVRGHGANHIKAFNKLKNCYISYVCDVDSKVGKTAAETIYKETGIRPKFVQDFREMLKDPSVDCVAICTPHHWHSLAAILCLQAGKHVYLEKPITHSYEERWSVLAAARKYGKIVQAGTQLRSNSSLKAAGEYMRAGKLGHIGLVHCIVHKDRAPVPLSNENKIPDSVDYDIWCGPADVEDVTRSKFHYHWHWLWQFGNGALGNNGIHRIDAARIALDLKGYGDLVVSLGDRYGPKDSGETPNNMLTLHKFGDTWILQDILGLKPEPYHGIENGVVFYGTKGTIVYKTGYAALVDENFAEIERFEGKQYNHYYNFLKAIRDKNASVIRGDLAEGILSSDLCHFGNASYRLGKPGTLDEASYLFGELNVPPMVQTRLEALRRNLEQNGIDPGIVIGDVLELGEVGSHEPVLNNPSAAQYLKANSRKGYALPPPDKV